MDIPQVIQHICPGSEWSCGDTYESLTWNGPGEKPTLAELQAAWDSRPVAPVVVSFRSLAFALLQAGLYEQVKAAALSTIEGEIWWSTAQSTTVQRDHPFVIALATAIGQTPEHIDAIFASAAANQF